MSIKELRNQLGDYAKDIKLNLGNVLSEEGAAGLSEKQIAGIALSSAYATKHKIVIEAISAQALEHLPPEEVEAAKAAATIMGMNNIYYRFTHLVSDSEYAKMPAKLRMNVIVKHGIDKADFELNSLAVSAINGCGACMDSHVNEVVKAGVSKEGVQSTIRIASVINATAQALIIGEMA